MGARTGIATLLAASIALCKKCGFCLMGRGVNAKGNEVFNWRLPL